MLSKFASLPGSQCPTSFNESLTKHFRIARHVFLVVTPVGALVGAAIAGYDYIVNVVLWERFVNHFPPLVLSLLPIAGMFLTGLILTIFRVPSSSMADEVCTCLPQAGGWN